MNPLTVGIGALAIGCGLYTAWARKTTPGPFSTLDAMKRACGSTAGLAIHVVSCTVARVGAGVLAVALAAALAAGCGGSGSGNPKVPAGAKSSGGKHAVLETDKGSIEIEFFEEQQPRAVENFRLLAEHGYYDGLIFHRIIRGFMIQGGDPMGNGTGGESAWGAAFADEIDPNSTLYRDGYRRGILAMANAGPNTNGSQFFIMHRDYPLPPSYVIFARVTSGLDVVDALAETPTGPGGDGENSRPLTPPVLKTVTVRP